MQKRMSKLAAMAVTALLATLLMRCGDGSSHSGDRPAPDSSLAAAADSMQLVAEPDSQMLAGSALPNDRENWQKPQMVISRLGDLSDKTVADIGAGTGYFSMRLARKAKKVIAIDIEQQFLDYIERRLERTRDRDGLNLETRLTEPDNPALADAEADMVLIVNTYGFIQNRVSYFRKVWKGMSPGAQLVIIDFKEGELPVGPAPEDKVSIDQIRAELDSAGFSFDTLDLRNLDYQFTLTMARP